MKIIYTWLALMFISCRCANEESYHIPDNPVSIEVNPTPVEILATSFTSSKTGNQSWQLSLYNAHSEDSLGPILISDLLVICNPIERQLRFTLKARQPEFATYLQLTSIYYESASDVIVLEVFAPKGGELPSQASGLELDFGICSE